MYTTKSIQILSSRCVEMPFLLVKDMKRKLGIALIILMILASLITYDH